jgi:hydroxyacylglutathione hydrolase
MQVVVVPCLKDNFAYLVIDNGKAAVVDPSEAAPVLAALAREGVTLTAIWLTHHHWDHVGGVKDLVAAQPDLEVVASTKDSEKIEGVTKKVNDGDTVAHGALVARVIDNPGHTLGAITFLVEGCAFTGDTLFAGGCGRVFEGDAAMMHASLMKLAALPADTKVYCGHEYTASNLRFAAAVEPDNQAIGTRTSAIPSPSVPSRMDEERATNPFLRAAEPAVIAAAKERGAAGDPVSVFAAIREWKNNFK